MSRLIIQWETIPGELASGFVSARPVLCSDGVLCAGQPQPPWTRVKPHLDQGLLSILRGCSFSLMIIR